MHFTHLTKYQKISLAAALLILLVAGISGLAIRTAVGVDYSAEVSYAASRFGEALDDVSLTAEGEELARQLDAAYTPFVTPELLSVWKANPSLAIGRATSSPWPDRIDVGTIVKNVDDSYTALGTVVEITSESDAPVAVYPVALTFVMRDGKWLVQDATKGSYIAVPERRTIEGTYACLIRVDMPSTDECAFGLKARDGRHYALDFTVLKAGDIMSRLITGEEVRIEGTFVPAEHLAPMDNWRSYDIDAVVRVTSLTEL
jgi:hypothetical protein